jgi:hypothetical protein
VILRDLARAGRRELEAALDAAGWPPAPRVSKWLDCLTRLEEATSS